jgi:genome maintenance exonuclease 1
MEFIHEFLELPKLERIHRDGVRYYFIPGDDEETKFVSITSVTSFYNQEIFKKWRLKVGDEEANRITSLATSRGTDTHSLIEAYTLNKPLPEVQEISHKLFEISKPALHRINKFYGMELGLYSKTLGVAGTVDSIADFDGELSIIDYKTSKYPKKKEWIEHYFVQAMAYGMMLHEITGLCVKKLVIIMTCENGELAVYEERDLLKYMKLVIKYLKHYVKENTKYGNR